jgi:cobalamin-dependent methionine synthase I
MKIIGERINATRKDINKAIAGQDVKFIQQEASAQVCAGADLLDVNCGIGTKEEASIEWVVRAIQEVTQVGLVIDSPDPRVLEKGLGACKGKAMVNSITAEPGRTQTILPLVRKYGASVVALTMDEKGMPETARQRFDIACRILEETDRHGIPRSDVYFDPLVRPISTEPSQGREFLEAIKLIKALPEVMTVCGLSNISFGLPERGVLNSNFLTMAIFAGLDAALVDPLNKKIMAAIRAGEALLGRDEYCMNYITAVREGKI